MLTGCADAGALQVILQDTTFSPARLITDLLRQPERKAAPRLPGIHASEVTKCIRQAVFTIRSAPKEPPPLDMRLRFLLGHVIHEAFQQKLVEACADTGGAITFEPEVSLNDTPLAQELDIKSSCDGILTFRAASGEVVVRLGLEIKTESSATWAKRAAPDAKHVEQGTVYMACLDLPAMYFMYVNKDSGAMTPFGYPFVQPFDPEMWARIRSKIETARSYTSRPQELPPATAGFHCSFCAYRGLCEPETKMPTMRHG